MGIQHPSPRARCPCHNHPPRTTGIPPVSSPVSPRTTGILPRGPPACFIGDGTAINSGFLNGLPTPKPRPPSIDWLELKGLGQRQIQYKLRDWLFSRQRYWGEPFPIVWKDGQHRLINEDELPLTLPEMEDFAPSPEGLAPLAKARDWLQLPDGSTRETNTMPQWAGSCWYYLRYLDPHNTTCLVDPAVERYWMGDHGVDLYVGGAEHAVLHLLYARFWHKVLFDLGVVSTPEPFHKLVNQGLILGEDGQKMSKSRGNVVNPDLVIAEYGADALRCFEMFMGPLEQVKPWSTQGVE
ncbi:MAG: class I tRNA ligase family protein, partial [Bdellovibrionaceae bacterium]|nr:class I tRNA ligase family protein [Pseudobdellovibrionaceae bacterium]